jgi:hypothetical protein
MRVVSSIAGNSFAQFYIVLIKNSKQSQNLKNYATANQELCGWVDNNFS